MDRKLQEILNDADSAFAQEKYEKASQLFKEALSIDVSSASGHYGLGSIALKQGRLIDALSSLEQASNLDPEAPDIAFNHGYALSLGGENIKALVAFQRASKFCRDDPVFCAKLAEVFLQFSEPAASIQMLSRLKALFPQDQIVMARANGALNNWKESVNILARLSKELPEEALVASELSLAAASHRDYEVAVSAYENYLRIVVPTSNDYLRFADLLLIAQLPERCEKAIELAIGLGEDSPAVYLLLAKVYRLKAMYEQASLALDKTLERMPNHGQAWSMRAELADESELYRYIEMLRQELAKEEQVLALNHHHQALLHYALAGMQERMEDYLAAADSFSQANKVQHDFLARSNAEYVPEQSRNYTDRTVGQFDVQSMNTSGANVQHAPWDKQPIFIVGMPRSGTTLVERILGYNKQVFNAGELEGMEFVATDFSHRQRTGKLPEVGEISSQQWTELRASYIDKLPEISKPIFTDKLPHNFRNVGLILKLFPDAKVVQVHRSIKDVCLSIFCHAFSQDHNYASSWSSLAHFHSESERLMKHWSSLKSDRLMDLNYEDLVRQPEEIGKQLVEFCGFSWSSDYLNFHKSINQSFTFSELEVRQPIGTQRIDRWRYYESAIPELARF